MSINQKLFDVQQEIGAISKDSTNPFYNSKYFDINSLIAQVLPLLKKNKVLLTQPIKNNKVLTILTCVETSEFVDGDIELPELKDPQKLGSAITYFRRYGLASILALQAQDDDANSTVGNVDSRPVLSQAGLDYILKGSVSDAQKALSERRVSKEFKSLIKKKHNI
tara:strand:+ start:1473 stop:1970 length:498 start_codon:yes stop_codon:yes gene_type:complete